MPKTSKRIISEAIWSVLDEMAVERLQQRGWEAFLRQYLTQFATGEDEQDRSNAWDVWQQITATATWR